jgi:FtsP/CotA-like multicopper oxidase with cupredoxin domain
MSKGMNRRGFLSRATVGVAGLALTSHALAGGRGGMGGGGMGGGGSVVDPPSGAALVDPPVAPSAAPAGSGLVDVTIEASVATVPLNGTLAQLLTYNGSFIAPTIRARSGDRVRLHFRNGLPATTETNLLGHLENVTNVHVHGWHVSPGNNMNGTPSDNVHVTVPAGGGQQDYEYDLSMQRPARSGSTTRTCMGRWPSSSGAASSARSRSRTIPSPRSAGSRPASAR